MKKYKYLEGFAERLDDACIATGLPKTEIARRCGFNRKQLMRMANHYSMNSFDVARFCSVTKTDANWLLGLTK